MSEFFKKISSDIIHQNPWWSYKHERYQGSDGKERDYYYGETEGSGCAMIIPLLPDGRLLLARQYRYLRDRFSIEFPCGGLHTDEPAETAARREFLEETGYTVSSLRLVGSFEGLNGLFRDTLYLFIGDGLEKIKQPSVDPVEEIELLERRPDEFDDMIRRGEIWDGQTLAAWTLARHNIMADSYTGV